MSARGNERVEPFALRYAWSGGAPMPHVLADDGALIVGFMLHVPDPDWDGSYVRVVDPSNTVEQQFGILEWRLFDSVRFGAPNDEALSGHPLWARGLDKIGYGAGVVTNSAWIEELERQNRVHEHHQPARFEELTHFVLVFHDNTLECVARGEPVQQECSGTFSDLLAEMSSMLRRGR